jgi:hypothetical protein
MSDGPEVLGGDHERHTQLPEKTDQSPDPRKIRVRRAKLAGWRRRLYDYIVVPAEVPEDFNQPLADLIDQLSPVDEKTAAVVLEEAEAIRNDAEDRIKGAERRATTLQGTVAIAASLVIGGAGLLLDPSKVSDRWWRIGFAVILALFLMTRLSQFILRRRPMLAGLR